MLPIIPSKKKCQNDKCDHISNDGLKTTIETKNETQTEQQRKHEINSPTLLNGLNLLFVKKFRRGSNTVASEII